MYEYMLENYGVFFEGLPEPVIYERYYPMGSKEGPYGSSLWDEFNYGRGLKKDRDPNEEHYRRFADQYETDLRRLLNTVMADSKGIRADLVSCNYYDFLAGDPLAVAAWRGEYMAQYAWAEPTVATLNR